MVLVFSSGRTGTNICLEVLTGNSKLQPSDPPEDKQVFKRNVIYPDFYLTKCSVTYCKNYNEFYNLMYNNPDTKIIWTIRHPFDVCLSKLYRGRPLPKRGRISAADATVEGCVKDLYKMFDLYKRSIQDFNDNILLVKMEDIITNIENESKRMCNFIGIPYQEDMKVPHLRMRHEGKRERYKTLDTNELNKYPEWKTLYNGFYNNFDIELLFSLIKPIKDYFRYK